MKHLLIFALLLLGAQQAFAQTTAVSATITDPNANPYAGGSVEIQLVPSSASPTVNGRQINGHVGPIALDANGHFTVNLFDNNVILPSGTQWQFSVRNPGAQPPVGTGPIFFSATITITGASQDISATLSALAPVLFKGGGSGLPANGLIGQTVVNTAPGAGSWQSSGVPLCNGGAVIAASPYSLLADSGTATRDRTSLCVVSTAGAGTFHVLAGSTAGVGTGFTFGFLNDGAGTWTIDNNAGSDTFHQLTGSANPAGTSFTVTTGQHFSIENSGVSNGSGGVIWYVREVTGGGGAVVNSMIVPRDLNWAMVGMNEFSNQFTLMGPLDNGGGVGSFTFGTGTSNIDANGVAYATASTGTTANTQQGYVPSTKAVIVGKSPSVKTSFGLGTTSSVNAWTGLCGFCNVSTAGSLDPSSSGTIIVAFRYFAASDSTWKCYVGDGVHAGQVVDSTIAPDTTNLQTFDVIVSAANLYTFYINGTSRCSFTPTNLPPATTNMAAMDEWQNTTTTSVTVKVGRLYEGSN